MEFDKYRRLGDYHWREFAKPTVYRDYVLGLREWVRGSRVLDVGAGDGLIAHVLEAEGVELDETAVGLAREHGVNVVHGDAAALPHPTASFDAVFMGDVIEHLQDPLPAVREAYRVLQSGGTFYVTTPPAKIPVRPYHYREYTPETLRDQIEPLGFRQSGPAFTRHDRIHAAFVRL